MDLKTKIAGIELQNPIMPASGPVVGDYDKMMAIAAMGVGGMVTKTISIRAANIPRPCIYGERDLLMNTELWSELPPEQWVDEILPRLKRDLAVPLVISVGYTEEDMKILIPKLDPFADAFEISTHYVGKDMAVIAATVRAIRANTGKPFLMKISPHIPDPAGFARMVRENGSNGIVAINSLGPTMKIDLRQRKTKLGNAMGQAWSSGPAIKPVALAIVNQIKEAVPELTVVGAGGVKTAEDVLEFLLAGADAVQMLSAAMLYGKDYYRKLVADLPGALQKYGFSSVAEVVATPLKKEEPVYQPNFPGVDYAQCNGCRICERGCPYFAIVYRDQIVVDPEKCFGCGLCESRCPTGAMRGVYSNVQ
jgi:dihydroorotate dehydrogenase subfamily 1